MGGNSTESELPGAGVGTSEAPRETRKWIAVTFGILAPLLISQGVAYLFFWLVGPSPAASAGNIALKLASSAANGEHFPLLILTVWPVIWLLIAGYHRSRRPNLTYGIYIGSLLGFCAMLFELTERVPIFFLTFEWVLADLSTLADALMQNQSFAVGQI